MKIALLTYHWVYNYGANLQVLSTQNYFNQLGHEVWVLNYRPKELEKLYLQRVRKEQVDTHESFLTQNVNQSPVCRNEEDLLDFCKEVDFNLIVVGSDAVFRLIKGLDREDTRFPNPFWLIWANTKLKSRTKTGVLAASAMGTNFISYQDATRKGIRSAINNMDYVSVRDRWTQWQLLLLTWGRCRPKLCPDPVTIFNDVVKIPDQYTSEPLVNHKKYVLISLYDKMVSKDWIQKLVTIAHEHELQVFSLPFPENEVIMPVDRVIALPLSPLEWYSWIKHAAGFVGVRMHPVLCSIVNDVPFVSFDTYQYNRFRFSSKTYNLCTQANARSLCFNNYQIMNLEPRQVFLMLKEQTTYEAYCSKAKQRFYKTVREILFH